jgi:putative ABC transport system substrate-binding protein
MRRREFIAFIGGAAALARPRLLTAQQAPMPRTIGYLGATTAAAEEQRIAVFVQRLRELGWTEGRTVAIDYRWAEGRGDRAAELAAEFTRLKVDVIVTYGTPMVAVARQATTAIPIVFAVADPVRSRLVESLARPGGNATGLSNQKTDLVGKRLELLGEMVPGLRRLAVIGNPENITSVAEMREADRMARTLGYEVATFEFRGGDDIGSTFNALTGSFDAIYVSGDPLVDTHRIRVASLAIGARLPTICDFSEYAHAGGLMTYGPNFPDLFRRAANYVDKILRGTKPADIPVEQPTKFDFVFNLKTAQALGLTVPPMLLARADQVIE